MLGKAQCPLSQAFLDDARSIDNTLEAARRVKVPWLLVHGTADELVPHSDSEEVCAVNSRARLELLQGADHRFAGQIPRLVELVSSFFDAAL
jgi:alpha-beta hydrolase superfamily lysophospholipase